MYKKLLISFGVLVVLAFSFTFCFANDNNMLQDAANGVRNVVGGAENAVEGAAKGVTNASKNVTGNMENGANKVGNDMTNNADTRNDNNDNAYTATRTSAETTANTFMGMTATAWTWLIMGIAAIAIVALVWYYGMQVNSTHYDDRD